MKSSKKSTLVADIAPLQDVPQSANSDQAAADAPPADAPPADAPPSAPRKRAPSIGPKQTLSRLIGQSLLGWVSPSTPAGSESARILKEKIKAVTANRAAIIAAKLEDEPDFDPVALMNLKSVASKTRMIEDAERELTSLSEPPPTVTVPGWSDERNAALNMTLAVLWVYAGDAVTRKRIADEHTAPEAPETPVA